MGNGYVRQSAADIVTGNTILPVHFNNEFNALRDAFDGVDGHSHDGTTGEGQKINLKTAITDTLDIVNGGTGAVNAGDARTNLGVAIGTNVQAYDAGLQSIAGLTTAANQMIYTTGSDVYATTALTPFARTLLDDADAATFKTTLALQNVDNTSDANKPVSTAQQTALDAKLNVNNPTYTGQITGPKVVLGNGGQLYDVNGEGTIIIPNSSVLKVFNTTGSTVIFEANNAATAPLFKGQSIYHTGNLPAMTQALAEAGTDTTQRTVAPVNIRQAILAQQYKGVSLTGAQGAIDVGTTETALCQTDWVATGPSVYGNANVFISGGTGTIVRGRIRLFSGSNLFYTGPTIAQTHIAGNFERLIVPFSFTGLNIGTTYSAYVLLVTDSGVVGTVPLINGICA